MRREEPQDELLTRYLLGELPEAEQSRLEEQYFANPQLFDELRTVRDDLIDAYVRDELSPDVRRRFEQFFKSSPRRRERIEFAEALLRAVDSRPATPAKQTEGNTVVWWQSWRELLTVYRKPIFGAAVLLIVIAGSWFVINRIRKPQPDGQEQVGLRVPESPATNSITPEETSSPQSQSSLNETPNPSPSPTPGSKPVFATFVLTSDLVRGSEESRELILPKDATMIELQLSLEGPPYQGYRAVIRTPEGAAIWSAKQLKPQSGKSGSVIVLTFPANLLSSADYIVRLNGVSAGNEFPNAGNYYFRLVKR